MMHISTEVKINRHNLAWMEMSINLKKILRCDRVLWHGDGIVQLSYFRGESKFSDHRPVCAAFIVEVGVLAGKPKPTQTLKAQFEERIGPSNSFSFFPDKGNTYICPEVSMCLYRFFYFFSDAF